MANNLFINVDFPTFGLPIIDTNPDLCSVIYSKSFPEKPCGNKSPTVDSSNSPLWFVIYTGISSSHNL